MIYCRRWSWPVSIYPSTCWWQAPALKRRVSSCVSSSLDLAPTSPRRLPGGTSRLPGLSPSGPFRAAELGARVSDRHYRGDAGRIAPSSQLRFEARRIIWWKVFTLVFVPPRAPQTLADSLIKSPDRFLARARMSAANRTKVRDFAPRKGFGADYLARIEESLSRGRQANQRY